VMVLSVLACAAVPLFGLSASAAMSRHAAISYCVRQAQAAVPRTEESGANERRRHHLYASCMHRHGHAP
jgi:hypothetical protein